VTQSIVADGTVKSGPLPPNLFPSATLIRLYEFLKNNSRYDRTAQANTLALLKGQERLLEPFNTAVRDFLGGG